MACMAAGDDDAQIEAPPIDAGLRDPRLHLHALSFHGNHSEENWTVTLADTGEDTMTGGRLKRGTVYVTLGRMQEKGYLESRQEPLPEGAIGLPRRLYRPTGHAMRVLETWRHAEQSFFNAPQLRET